MFLQTSIPPLISILYAKEYHDFPLKFLVSMAHRTAETIYLKMKIAGKNALKKKYDPTVLNE